MRKIERKSEQVEVNSKVFTINEITAELAEDMFAGKKQVNAETMQQILSTVCDATHDDYRGMTIGQLEGMYEVFREVNQAFFKILPLDKILEGYQESIVSMIKGNLSGLSANLSPPDTVTPGDTAGATSVTA